MSVTACAWRDQPALSLALPAGDRVVVAIHGAHVLSWCTADGTERLYLSPEAVFDGRSAIRGGVPICCPQFNTRGILPKHGFMRNVPWVLEEGNAGSMVFGLRADDATRAIWPYDFHARLRVALAPQRLHMALELTNTGHDGFDFSAALHSYLRVDDIATTRLDGLQGLARWDAVRDARGVEADAQLRFDAEFDSVYSAATGAPAAPLRLVQPAGVLEIAQSASCTETVVWNPGAVLSAKLGDMPDDGYRHMLCVEAARIDVPVRLAPGATWTGWQQLTVL